MINRLISYLQLNRVGLYEILIAMYPIMAGYAYGSIHVNMVFIVFLAIIGLLKRRRPINVLWLTVLLLYVIFHEAILIARVPAPNYLVNSTISIASITLSIIPICRAINVRKFIGSLNWISLISIGGLLYQFAIVFAGGKISPLKLPFMPDMSSSSRMFEVVVRPTSFFWEPAAFVTFLMIPLFISLAQKRYIWSAVLMISMFLSTSSTGILMSFAMLLVYAVTQRISLRTRILVIVLGLGMEFFLVNSAYFEAGVNKIESTDVERNARLMNGIYLFKSLDFTEILVGIDAANVTDYYEKNGGTFIKHIGERNIFVPTFWLTWAKYGIGGLTLLLILYWSFVRMDKKLLPYIVVITVSLFFQSISIGSSNFAYQLIFLYSWSYRESIERKILISRLYKRLKNKRISSDKSNLQYLN